MTHAYSGCLERHALSKEERRRSIARAVQQHLWPYLGGITRENGTRAVAVGISVLDDTVAHIHVQEEPRRAKSFEEELLAFLDRHQIEYDRR